MKKEFYTQEDRKSVLEKIPPFLYRAEGYPLMYADCPWKYRDKANAGERGADYKYPTLTVGELKALRPEALRLAGQSCALGFWATAPMMAEAREVLAAWGFKYSTIAVVWIKSTKVAERLQAVAKKLGVSFEDLVRTLAEEGLTVFRPKKGMGNWTRSNAEFLLLGTRGKVERVSKGIGSVVVTEPREHSRKPDEVRDLLVQLFGEVPRIELFARESAAGWDSWGLEVGVFDEEEGVEDGRD